MREVTCRILASNGYQVITAVNGLDAIRVAASHPGNIDVLVTDVVMPKMFGKESADRIHAQALRDKFAARLVTRRGEQRSLKVTSDRKLRQPEGDQLLESGVASMIRPSAGGTAGRRRRPRRP
jgi:CheY-like chemotaxis protein